MIDPRSCLAKAQLLQSDHMLYFVGKCRAVLWQHAANDHSLRMIQKDSAWMPVLTR
jgi:hypothetical protein